MFSASRAKKAKPRKRSKRAWLIAGLALALLAAAPFALSGYVRLCAKDRILTAREAAGMEADCILVLGAGVWGEGENAAPSHMLADRLQTAVSLYEAGAANRLLMSGDHGRADYDEVNVMLDYALARNVPREAVFMDHAGFSTYESMYRARDVFEAKRIIIVTQEYHLYRALYVANALGLEAWGVAADLRPYAGQRYYDLREIFARDKDFFMALFKPKPTYLGEAIPVSGDGRLTDG